MALTLVLTLSGCAYALHPVTLPTQLRVKVVAQSPEAYNLRLRIGDPRNYRIPSDGRVVLDVPAYRAACTIYLFGKLPMPNHSDPYTAKAIELSARGTTARQLSLKKLSALPVDADGYHLLRLPNLR